MAGAAPNRAPVTAEYAPVPTYKTRRKPAFSVCLPPTEHNQSNGSVWSGTATASVGDPRHPIYEEIDQLAQKLDPHRKCQLNWTHCGSGGETDEDPRRPREMPGPQPLQGGGARVVCTRPFWQRKRRGRWPRASGICGEGTACHCQLPRVGD